VEESSVSTRYRLIHKIATGGVATVWIGAVRGGLGFRQLVAIKKPHQHLFEQPQIRNELITEARLASMIQHGNVVDVRDVDVQDDQINLVMDYIEGASLSELARAAKDANVVIPPKVVLRIILDACAGLHAAHELVDEEGKPASLVHRDVSPQNILVGLDGITRVTDFGIAKAMTSQDEKTDEGLVKGKLSYMSPEYLTGKGCDRRLDVFALGTVCWEALANERCFKGDTDLDTANRILKMPARRLSAVAPDLDMLDDVLVTAMERRPDKRFPTMRAFATALESAGDKLIGTHADVANTVKSLMGAALDERRAKVRAILAAEGIPLSQPRLTATSEAKISAAGPAALESAADAAARSSGSDSSGSRNSPVVALSSGLPPAPSDELSLGAALPSTRRRLRFIVGGVCAAALLLLVIGVAASSGNKPPPTNANAGKATASTSTTAADPPPPSDTTLAHREQPIPEPPPIDELPADPPPTSSSATTTSSAPATAPHPAPAPWPRPVTGPRPTGSGRKPVPPNPYGKW
jgi:serine/threonine-protein kinase